VATRRRRLPAVDILIVTATADTNSIWGWGGGIIYVAIGEVSM